MMLWINAGVEKIFPIILLLRYVLICSHMAKTIYYCMWHTDRYTSYNTQSNSNPITKRQFSAAYHWKKEWENNYTSNALLFRYGYYMFVVRIIFSVLQYKDPLLKLLFFPLLMYEEESVYFHKVHVYLRHKPIVRSYFGAEGSYCFLLSGEMSAVHLVADWLVRSRRQATSCCGHTEELQRVLSQEQHVTHKRPSWLTACYDNNTVVPGHWLTILAVVGDLNLAFLGPHQSLGHLADGLFVRQVTVEEVTGARLLHDVWSWEAGHLTEAIIAVDDCTVLHPGIGYHKFPVCMKRKSMHSVGTASCGTSDLGTYIRLSAHR